MSLAFKPTVNTVMDTHDEERELNIKLAIIKELEQCPMLMQHMSDQADAILVEMGTRNWTGEAKNLQDWALRKVAEIGVYKYFVVELVGNKAAILQKLQHVQTLNRNQE